jgi:4-hydroxy-3-polyprenylbenzoate decarboxylase
VRLPIKLPFCWRLTRQPDTAATRRALSVADGIGVPVRISPNGKGTVLVSNAGEPRLGRSTPRLGIPPRALLWWDSLTEDPRCRWVIKLVQIFIGLRRFASSRLALCPNSATEQLGRSQLLLAVLYVVDVTHRNRLVVGVSGATGIVYASRMLQMLREANYESHLVVSRAADLTRVHETTMSSSDLRELADFDYPIRDIGAPIASGSFLTMGMVIVPCSARTMAAIAYGVGDNLLTRAADVALKERRRLVLMLRESPLSLAHCRAAVVATEIGAIVAPPVPAFYLQPSSIGEMIDQSVSRVLDLFAIETNPVRWGARPDPTGGQMNEHAK